MANKYFRRVADKGVIEGMVELFERAPELAADVAREALAKVKPSFLDDLQYTPGPVKKPIVWTSAKQRRAYFATKGFGHGIPYQRTGAMAKGWRIEPIIDTRGASIVIKVYNNDPKTAYVVGAINNYQAAPDDYRPMQQMHANTGWQPAAPTIRFFVEAYTEEVRTGLRAAVHEWIAER